MNSEFVKKYLERIKYYGEVLPNIDTLKKIHRQHLLNVPFENLNIFINRKIDLNIDNLWCKIVEENRGGICYELNGLLYHLLKNIGFSVKYISARVLENGNEFDHVLLLVLINNESYLVDVGFGDNFLEPIKLILDDVLLDVKGNFKIIKNNNEYQLLKSLNKCDFSLEYIFTLQERNLEDFFNRCTYFETSLESRFKKKRICSIEKENGRVSLTDNKLIVTENKIQFVKEINNEDEFISLLKEYFSIDFI